MTPFVVARTEGDDRGTGVGRGPIYFYRDDSYVGMRVGFACVAKAHVAQRERRVKRGGKRSKPSFPLAKSTCTLSKR